MTPRQKEVAEGINARRPEGLQGPYLALLYAPEVAERMQRLDDELRFNLRLPERLRALATLAAAGRHGKADIKPFAELDANRKSGLTAATFEALAEGRKPENMQEDEDVVYEIALQVTQTGHVKNALFDRAVQLLGREQCLEVVEVCGFTAFMSKVMNVTQRNFSSSP